VGCGPTTPHCGVGFLPLQWDDLRAEFSHVTALWATLVEHMFSLLVARASRKVEEMVAQWGEVS
jgi:hypothetical protein